MPTTVRNLVTRAIVAVAVVLSGTVVVCSTAAPASAQGSSLPAVPAGQLTSAGVSSFVRAMYQDFLGRTPSTADLISWGPRVQAEALTRSDMGLELARSPEWLTVVITGFYRDALSREPDPAGLAHWIAKARAGKPIADIAAEFYGSTEYFQTVGRSDTATWVRALYRALLHREGEPAGVAHWVGLVDNGMSRSQASVSFYQSTETIRVRITALYRTLLGRAPDPSGLRTWPPVVRADGDLALAAAIAGSPEYYARAAGRHPTTGRAPWVEVVGSGTAASCTSAALATAVRDGGVVEFSCGPAPVTITVSETLSTCNTTTCRHQWQGATPVELLVLDGAGLVTLSGGGSRGIYYANTCEADFGWVSSRCDLETRPRVVFRNLGFTDGNAQYPPPGRDDVGGGGAIAMRGGTLVVDNSRFARNRTVTAHPDWGGGAIRVTGSRATATITRSTFTDNQGANGGAISSLHTSLAVDDSVFTANRATGSGASTGQGGNGGAIYVDGTDETVRVTRSTLTGNVAPEGGSGIFYVSNSRTGQLTIEGSTVTGNTGETFWTSPYHDVFYLGRTALPVVSASTID